jgi:tetratricopeptide (TPR) repeat protein
MPPDHPSGRPPKFHGERDNLPLPYRCNSATGDLWTTPAGRWTDGVYAFPSGRCETGTAYCGLPGRRSASVTGGAMGGGGAGGLGADKHQLLRLAQQPHLGALDSARQHHERALAIFAAAQEPNQTRIGITVGNLGLVLRRLGDVDGARQHQERALAIKRAALGPDHPEVAVTLYNLGDVLEELGDLDGARQQYERALAIEQASLGPDRPRT